MGMRIQVGQSKKSNSGKPASVVGKVLITGFLMIFVVAGLVAGSVIFQEIGQGFEQETWVERPCTIQDSGIKIDHSSNAPYTPWVNYTYEHGGKPYQSSTLTSDLKPTDNYRDAQAYTLAYPAGSQATCFVDPDMPRDAVLKNGGTRSLLISLGIIVFMTMFSGIPLLIIIGIWRSGTAKDRKEKRAKAARERGKGKASGRLIGTLFGGVFAVAGLAMLIFMTILPLYRTAIAQSWAEVDCDIKRSSILRHDGGDDGPTYSIDILYFYDIEGKTYGSNRYSFASFGSSSGQKGKRKVANQYKVGQTATCFVNPNDPTRAVLQRGLTKANLWGLFPLPFFLIGIAVIYGSLFGTGKTGTWRPGGKAKAKANTAKTLYQADPSDEGPVVLKPGSKRVKSFILTLIFALIWNGVTAALLVHLVGEQVNKDEWDLFPLCFLGLFQLIGLIVIGFACRSLMLVFAPSVIVELGRRSLPVGGSTELRWHISGNPNRVDHITITLIGEEQATYRRGTDTITDKKAFYQETLAGGGEADDESISDFDTLGFANERGEVLLQVPQDTMHSFEASNNKIVWRLVVTADVPRWPDPKDEYELTVLPMPVDLDGR